jgi:hypothetical protein
MPLDFTAEEIVPDHINFPVIHEPTKFDKSKYVVNGNTGEYLGIVGTGFPKKSHGEYFTEVHNGISNHFGMEFCNNMNIKFKTAHNNAWVLMDMVMPNVLRKIESDKHTTTIAPRLIALHGLNGTCSNQVYFGSIDFFCTNGMITGDFDQVKRKNSSNFVLERFIKELKDTVSDFNESANKYQKWAEKKLMASTVKDMLENIMSKSKSEKMFSLYNYEASTRGQNVWALYSAFTNFSSHQGEDNGFALRKTGNDTQAKSMWDREQEVAKWTSTPQFRQLVAA